MNNETICIEVEGETIANTSEQILTQLNELSLAFIGGGLITVSL
jgi:hypothetical protein